VVERELLEAIDEALPLADPLMAEELRELQDAFLTPGRYEAHGSAVENASAGAGYSPSHQSDDGPAQP
jgi:hypothetical protein